MRLVVMGLYAALLSPAAMAAEQVDRGNGMYFSRPGATLEAMLADTTECRSIAEGAQSQINGVSVLVGGVGAIIGGAIAGGRLKRVNTENCMLIRGWRLYAMTRTEGAAWKALGEAKQRAALSDLVGAEAPKRGSLLRAWHNDYAEPVLWQKD